jgi:hypothetical protein
VAIQVDAGPRDLPGYDHRLASDRDRQGVRATGPVRASDGYAAVQREGSSLSSDCN